MKWCTKAPPTVVSTLFLEGDHRLYKKTKHEPESDPASSVYLGFLRFLLNLLSDFLQGRVMQITLLKIFFGQSILSQQHYESRTTTMHRCFTERILLIYLILPVTKLYLSDLCIFFTAYFNLVKWLKFYVAWCICWGWKWLQFRVKDTKLSLFYYYLLNFVHVESWWLTKINWQKDNK